HRERLELGVRDKVLAVEPHASERRFDLDGMAVCARWLVRPGVLVDLGERERRSRTAARSRHAREDVRDRTAAKQAGGGQWRQRQAGGRSVAAGTRYQAATG